MKLTVITAVYNRLEYLKRAIESLDNQTYNDFEHIIVDDCSTEITQEQLVNLCSSNPRRRLVLSKIRCHYYGAIARNIGAMMAFSYIHHSKRDINNEWIVFLDTDNIFTNDHLQSIVDLADKNINATMIASDAVWVGQNDNNWKEIRPCRIRHCGCDLGQFAYKTELFRKYGYFFPHPHKKHKYDFELIEKMATGERDSLLFTRRPTFIMNYKKR